jgi:hypothetical protein
VGWIKKFLKKQINRRQDDFKELKGVGHRA